MDAVEFAGRQSCEDLDGGAVDESGGFGPVLFGGEGVDVIAGSGAPRAHDGHLVLNATEPALGPDGVTMTAGQTHINDVALAGIADKLTIPIGYLRRLATDHVEIFDANINGWLDRTDRRFLIRTLRSDTGGGMVRAFLSDRYARIDNLDVLLAALDSIRAAGMPIEVDGCDLTDKRMYLRPPCGLDS